VCGQGEAARGFEGVQDARQARIADAQPAEDVDGGNRAGRDGERRASLGSQWRCVECIRKLADSEPCRASEQKADVARRLARQHERSDRGEPPIVRKYLQPGDARGEGGLVPFPDSSPLLGARRNHDEVVPRRRVVPPTAFDPRNTGTTQHPGHLHGGRALADEADACVGDSAGDDRRGESAGRRQVADRRRQLAAAVRRGSRGQQPAVLQERQRLLHRLLDRRADELDHLCDGSGSVEERQQPRQQPAHRRAFERDHAAAVLEDESLPLLDDAVPRRKQREVGQLGRAGYHRSQMKQSQQQLQQQTEMFIAARACRYPTSFAARSSRSSVSCRNIATSFGLLSIWTTIAREECQRCDSFVTKESRMSASGTSGRNGHDVLDDAIDPLARPGRGAAALDDQRDGLPAAPVSAGRLGRLEACKQALRERALGLLEGAGHVRDHRLAGEQVSLCGEGVADDRAGPLDAAVASSGGRPSSSSARMRGPCAATPAACVATAPTAKYLDCTATPTSPVSGSAATSEHVTRRILTAVTGRCERELTRGALLRAGAAFAVAGPHRFTRRALRHELRIMQWAHPTPGYDAWLARVAARWGERNDARVTIDHVNPAELSIRSRAELATRNGHDLVQFLVAPTAFQLDAGPLDDAVAEVSRTLGVPSAVARGAAYNRHTKRWFAFPDHYVPVAAVRRNDDWPEAPGSWEDVLARASELRRARRPVAIGLSGELDSNVANVSLLLAFGGSLARLDTPQTVEYLRFVARLYRTGMPREVIQWNPASNNQLLFAGRASLITNPLTVIRAAERVRLPFADRLGLAPLPGGVSAPHTTGSYVLWPFSPNRELAERYLVDQQLAYGEHFVRSGFLNVPAWTAAVPDGFAGMRRLAAPRYAAVADAAAQAVGVTDGAEQELLDGFIVPTIARRVAQGSISAADAAAQAGKQAEDVYRKWREAKLI
jgi:ABC-type glycerol-3-phosphate transport system substrate-binding protein